MVLSKELSRQRSHCFPFMTRSVKERFRSQNQTFRIDFDALNMLKRCVHVLRKTPRLPNRLHQEIGRTFPGPEVEARQMLVHMLVRGLMFDPYNNAYIVILRDENDSEVLPIWVGKPEAGAISFALEGVTTPRPMTHDLTKNILESLEAKVISIVITDLKDNTYFAKLHIVYGDSEYTVDSRPSDAIALALRTDASIFAQEDVLRKHSSEELDRWLDNLKPEDFERYDA